MYTYASNLVVGVTLAQNMDGKCDKLIAYALRLLSSMEQIYITMEREVLAMVYTFRKFHHYLLSKKNVFNVNNMALTYLVC
jgi:hypothetical protein